MMLLECAADRMHRAVLVHAALQVVISDRGEYAAGIMCACELLERGEGLGQALDDLVCAFDHRRAIAVAICGHVHHPEDGPLDSLGFVV